MKKILSIVFLIPLFAQAQKGDELLVYSLKGNATVVENNKESKLKIGKVLKPGCTLKTQRDAKLTMVCKEGKPLSVTKEGSFPVGLWKDSCETSHGSVTSKYFQYIWDQLYVRSDDYKKEHLDVSSSLNEAPVRGQEEPDIIFNVLLDTVYYNAGDFPLSWTTSFPYFGSYLFCLYAAGKETKPLFKDSLSRNEISLQRLKKYMKQGGHYYWTVETRSTGTFKGGVINYVTANAIGRHIIFLQNDVNVPEDPAARYFRVGYLLLHSYYPVNAMMYYQKAKVADPASEFYKEKLEEFNNLFFQH